VEEFVSLSNLKDIGTKGNLQYEVDPSKLTHASKEELMHSKGVRTPLYF
jgi:hypothetical protein